MVFMGNKIRSVTGQSATVMPEYVEEKPNAAGTENGTVRISFRMNKGLHTRLKLAAVRQGRSIMSMLEGFVDAYTPAD